MSFVDLIPWRNPIMSRLGEMFSAPNRLILIRAPSGVGKTSVAVAYAIWSALHGERTAIFLRTKREVEHALGIAGSILSRLDNPDILITPTPSRTEMCVMGYREIPIRFMCPAVDCERLANRKISDIIKTLKGTTYDRLLAYKYIFSRGGRCPYIVARELLRRAHVVIGVHEYFSDSCLYSSLGELSTVIIDEAHSFLLMRYEFSLRLLKRGETLASEFYDAGGRNLGRYIVALWREGRRNDSIALSQYYQYMACEGEEIRVGDKILKVPTPIDIIRRRIRRLRRIIVMSSTLYPSSFFEVLFSKGLQHEMFVIPGIIGGRRIQVLDTKLSMGYNERNMETFRQYARLIRKIAEREKSKVIVFTPSYEVAKHVAKFLGVRPTDQFDQEIVVTVYRGKISEGIEPPPEYSVAILAGLPYPKINLEDIEVLKIYSKEYGISLDAMKKAYVESSMMSALIQAMGRVGRRGEGKVYIVDRRAMRILGHR